MARIVDVITNFSSGALSPLLEGRTDLKKYEFNGLQELYN